MVKQTAAHAPTKEGDDREKHEWESEYPRHVRKPPEDGMRGAVRRAKRQQAVAGQGKYCNGEDDSEPPWKRYD